MQIVQTIEELKCVIKKKKYLALRQFKSLLPTTWKSLGQVLLLEVQATAVIGRTAPRSIKDIWRGEEETVHGIITTRDGVILIFLPFRSNSCFFYTILNELVKKEFYTYPYHVGLSNESAILHVFPRCHELFWWLGLISVISINTHCCIQLIFLLSWILYWKYFFLRRIIFGSRQPTVSAAH